MAFVSNPPGLERRSIMNPFLSEAEFKIVSISDAAFLLIKELNLIY